MSKHLSVIIPAYNEEHHIKETLGSIYNYLLRQINRFGFDIEILALAKKPRLKIKEAPIIWNNSGESKVHFI